MGGAYYCRTGYGYGKTEFSYHINLKDRRRVCYDKCKGCVLSKLYQKVRVRDVQGTWILQSLRLHPVA